MMQRLLPLIVMLSVLWTGPAQANSMFTCEPLGSTLLTDWGFNSTTLPTGWASRETPVPLVTDSTAPASPSSVLHANYPIGFQSGGGPIKTEYVNVPFGTREIFIGTWWKPSGPTWQGDVSQINKVTFMTASPFVWGLVFEMFGDVNGPFSGALVLSNTEAVNTHLTGAKCDPVGTCIFHPNVSAGAVTLGAWHRIEHYYKQSTTLTSQDGILKIWMNGKLIISRTNVNFPQQSMGAFQFAPTWGGASGSPTKRQNDHFYYDHVRISLPHGGSPSGDCGSSAPSDTTSPGPTTNLAASETTSTSTKLDWTNAIDTGGSGFKGTVLLRCQGIGCVPTQSITTVLAPTATYRDVSLAAGTRYGYSAQGIDNAGNPPGPLTATVYVDTPAAGSGAISIDSVVDSVANNTSAVLPVFAHTVAAGSNRLLTVCTQSRGTQANVPVSSILYGAAPLTFVRGDTRTDGSGAYFRTELWRLLAPSVGTANVAVTFAGAPSSYGAATSISYQGVDQTTPIEVSAGGSNNTSATLAVPITTLTSDAWIEDCAIGRADTPSGFVAVGAGQVVRSNRLVNTTDSIGVSTVNGKTPAGSETMDWAQASASDWVLTAAAIKPATSGGATPEPVVDSFTRTATSMAITYGSGSPTLPTKFQLVEGIGSSPTPLASVVYTRAVPPFNSATATTAIMTVALSPGAQYACIIPINAAGVLNPNINDRKCNDVTGLAPIDTAAPILGTVRANGNTAAPQLPNGATTVTLSFPVDKSLTLPCLWDTTTHATYALFPAANTMSFASLTASVVVSSGVPAYPATQAYYFICQFTDVQNATHDSAVSSITVSAAAPAGDTTPPVAVNVTAFTADGPTQGTMAWDAVGGDVTGYTPFCSFGTGSTTYVPCANETLLTTQLLNLPANTVVNGGVWAHDLAGNVSANSNIRTITTPANLDVNPPTNPGTLSVDTYAAAAILSWIPNGSDGEGPISTLVEFCLQVAAPIPCTDFAFKKDNISDHVVAFNLASATNYCWRIWHVDQASNKSLAPSNVACAMTKATGLPQPRTPVPFPGRTQVPVN